MGSGQRLVTSARDLAAVRTTSLPGSLSNEVAVRFIGGAGGCPLYGQASVRLLKCF